MTGIASCRRAAADRGADVAQRIEEGRHRKARAQRRPAEPRDVEVVPPCRMPPSVRITSDSCSRAMTGFSTQRRPAARRRVGGCFGARRVRPAASGSPVAASDGVGRQTVGRDEPAGGGQRAEHEAEHREHAHRRRERAPLRHGGFADDARGRGVEGFLLLGFARALEEGLIDVAAGLDVALELAQAHRGLAELELCRFCASSARLSEAS